MSMPQHVTVRTSPGVITERGGSFGFALPNAFPVLTAGGDDSALESASDRHQHSRVSPTVNSHRRPRCCNPRPQSPGLFTPPGFAGFTPFPIKALQVILLNHENNHENPHT